MKKLVALLVMLTVLVSMSSVFAYESANIIINDEEVTIPEDYGRVMIVNERTMVPVRFLLSHLNFSVTWDEANQTVLCADNANIFLFQIGLEKMFFNNQTIEIDSAPFLDGERTYLPLRVLAENLGYTVAWNDETGTVSMKK